MTSNSPLTVLTAGDLREIIRSEITVAIKHDDRLDQITPNAYAAMHTVKDLMRILRRSEPWVQREIQNGGIEGIKIGGDWRVTQSALDEYIQTCIRSKSDPNNS